MWIYYYASYGPGHQSRSADFVQFEDDAETENIKDCLFHRLRDQDNISLNFWQVPKPPADVIVAKMENLELEIEMLQKEYDRLDHQACSHPLILEGKDEELQEALKKKDDVEVLFALHKEGFIYTYEDIKNFYWGKKKLWKEGDEDSKRILEIIKECKSY